MLPPSMFTPAVATMFFFQMVFMDTTCTIPTGALAERWKITHFVLFSFVIATIIYPVYGNWVWGGGWLSTLGANFGLGHGHVDFAGSSVVHMTGGVIAIVTSRILGPRIGKYTSDGRINPIPPHNIAYVMTGTFILAFGWFGFNAGSTLAGTDGQLAIVAVNTMLASASGAFAAYLFTTWKFGKPDPSWLANGMLAGLVAITAPCAFVDSLGGRSSSAPSPACWWWWRRSSSTPGSRSTTRSAPSPSTASTAPSACSRSASSPTASTATGSTA